MNWPAPSLLSPAVDEPDTVDASDASDATAPPAPPESAEDRRRLSAVPAAAWVAFVGGALVLLAAATVVANNWDALGRGLRFAGLVAGTAGLVMIAERLRRVVPTTAGIIAHVGAYLATPIGIAGMSMFGFTWPSCLVVGGAVAIVVTEIQARRWKRTTFQFGQVAAVAILATGLADLTDTTGGLIAGIVAMGLLAVGAHRRAAGVAVLAVLSPALTALADAGIGAGTFERAGLVGERLSWSGPIVGVLAAMVLGIVATQRRNNGLMLMAAAAPVIGVVTGLAAVDGSAVAWLSLPALVVIAAELGWWLLPTDRFRSPITVAVNAAAGTLAVAAWVAPALAATDPFDAHLRSPWALAATLTALAMMLATLRLRADDHVLANVAIAAASSSVIAGFIALGSPAMLTAGVAVAVVPLAAFLSRRLHPIAVYVPACWAMLSIAEIDPSSTAPRFIVGALLTAALVGVVIAARARLAAANHWIGWLEMFLVTAAAAALATEFVPGHGPAAALSVAAIAATGIVLAERRLVVWDVATVATIGVISADAATNTGAVAPTYWIGWTVATAAFTLAWSVTRTRTLSYAAAATGVVALATSMAAFPLTAEDFIGVAMAGVAVLTGLAFTVQRRSPLDAAAIAAGCVLLATTAFDVDPSWVSAVWVVLGLQIASYGLIARQPVVSLGGAVVTLVAAGSWWFTSGLHDWFLDVIAPAGITVGDLWAAAASTMALVAGFAVRKTLGVNSWFAYSGALAIAGLWLTSVQIERDTVWALPLALTIGLVAVSLGAWHRLAAPLVGGTVLTAVTVFVASGSDLRAIPGWAWLAVGGTTLMGVAVLIERAGKPGTAGLKELVDRWQ